MGDLLFVSNIGDFGGAILQTPVSSNSIAD
jgi:hypothetical protein